MINLTNLLTPIYNDNLISQKLDYTVFSGGANFVNSLNKNTEYQKGVRSIALLSNNSSPIILDLNYAVDSKVISLKGFTFNVFKSDNVAFNINVKVFFNTSLLYETDMEVSDIGSNWQTFGQTFQGNNGKYRFRLEIDSESAGSQMFISGFKFEDLNKGFTMPSVFTMPTIDATGWNSRVDLDTVSLGGGIENLVEITTGFEFNGNLSLMDLNSKITPITLGDEVKVDFACTFLTPSGSNNSVDILFKVGADVYRGLAFTYLLSKGEGIEDMFSISWSMPVDNDFLSNGGEIYLKPNTNMNVTNRYIKVSRSHVGN